MSKVYRKETLKIDFSKAQQRPTTLQLHELIQAQLCLTVDEVRAIDFNLYKKCVYIKVTSLSIAERTLQHCKGVIRYYEDDLVSELPVELVNEEVVIVNVSNVPLEISDNQVGEVFSRYGVVIKVVPQHFQQPHVYPVYSGKRLVYLRPGKTEIPPVLDICGQRVSVFCSFQTRKCFRCFSSEHMILN